MNTPRTDVSRFVRNQARSASQIRRKPSGNRPSRFGIALASGLAISGCTLAPVQCSTIDTPKEQQTAVTQSERKAVPATLEELKSKPSVLIDVNTKQWTIVIDESTKSIWSFVPSSHYAYPAAVRRQWQGSGYMKIEFLCDANQEQCNKFMREALVMAEVDIP